MTQVESPADELWWKKICFNFPFKAPGEISTHLHARSAKHSTSLFHWLPSLSLYLNPGFFFLLVWQWYSTSAKNTEWILCLAQTAADKTPACRSGRRQVSRPWISRILSPLPGELDSMCLFPGWSERRGRQQVWPSNRLLLSFITWLTFCSLV